MKTLLICIALLFYSNIAFSARVPLAWDVSYKATGYKLQVSIDLGETWGDPVDVGNVLEYTLNVPDNTLVLIRNTAYNLGGESTRGEGGVWYNSSWVIPNRPVGLGAFSKVRVK